MPPPAASAARGAAPRPVSRGGGRGRPAPPIVLAARGITIKVGNNAAMSFDTETLRWAGAWAGGFLDLSHTSEVRIQGNGAAMPGGPLAFSTLVGPGWAKADNFTDPRPGQFGALPAEWAHYKGLYRHGQQVVLSYSVGNVDVLELPGSAMSRDSVAFTRTLHIAPSTQPLALLVCDLAGGSPVVRSHFTSTSRNPKIDADNSLTLTSRDGATTVTVASPPDGLKLELVENTRIVARLAPSPTPVNFKLIICKRSPELSRQSLDLPKSTSEIEDLPSLCKGGPALWGEPIVTQGHRAADNKAYVVDTIAPPENNPWHAWMRPVALDFFSDGRCAVSTMNGDVWIVSNIDDNLQRVSWKRFATGLYEPLGLRIVDDQIYVLGRDQITRLHDLNGSGEADFYENFSNGGVTSPIYHAFKMDLQTDSEGNFYYCVDGNQIPINVPMHGAVLKVSKDGKRTEVVCTGLRAANGSGMSPDDELVCSDNQGYWTPVCRINLVKPGGFYGHCGDPRAFSREELARAPKVYDPPLCWIPYEKDNSTGGQIFVSNRNWGPLDRHMLSTSYGKCRLFEVMWERVEGVAEGATVELPLEFDSGIQRARANPADGQIYVCGLKGWQTAASHDGCLQRVRYTGKPFRLPTDVHLKSNGIAITFDCPLDPTTANDDQSFGVEEWNYRWSQEYGSKKYKPSDGAKVGTDEVNVKSAKLLADRKTVFLEIPTIHPVMQMGIQVHINAADGTPIECEVDETINHLPGSSMPAVLSNQ
ncbi:MAG TPA: DUF6797 domain-containing protein, partial [Tepidisphaeraceae bacterium]|nr:DUF6797 domain-containing protein [Tepidisphaeraceae bacterium]